MPNLWRTGPIDSPAPKAHPDFSQDVIDDLYRYRPRHLAIAYLIALPLGVLGTHRFYCGKPFTGVLMLFTAGGGLL